MMKLPKEIIEEITPEIELLEQQKKSDLKVLKKYAFILLAVFFISLIILSVFEFSGFFNLFIYLFFLLLIFGFYKIFKMFTTLRELFKNDFKDIVMPAIFEAIDMNLTYRKDYFIQETEFLKSEIFPYDAASYFGEDYISGKIGSTSFELSELSVYRKSEEQKSELTFNGWFMIADFNKNFNGKTFLIPEAAGLQSGLLAQSIMKLNPARYELARLEDPEFEKRFAIYTTDQIETRYILSPNLMQHLSELTTTYNRDIRISFIDSKIYIGVSSYQNLFNPPFLNSQAARSTIELFIAQLMGCLNIIDILNLNTRIWTKE